MRQYYKCKANDFERILDEKITGGVILGTFCKESGHQWGGHTADKIYVTDSELELEWDQYAFAVEKNSNEEVESKIEDIFRKLMHQFNNYGLWEDAHDDTTAIEQECRMIKEALFGEHKDDKAFGYTIDRSIKESFPEDFADELVFNDSHAFFQLMFELRDPVRELANMISKESK